MGWAGFLRKTRPNYVSPMGRVIEVTTRPWVTHGPGWAGPWAGLMRPNPRELFVAFEIFFVQLPAFLRVFWLLIAGIIIGEWREL